MGLEAAEGARAGREATVVLAEARVARVAKVARVVYEAPAVLGAFEVAREALEAATAERRVAIGSCTRAGDTRPPGAAPA